MSQSTELPAGWREGYGMYPAASADASAVYLRDEEPHPTLVRWDYRRDGYSIFQFWPQLASHRVNEAIHGTWFRHSTAPVFDDPIAAMVWLEVQGE